MRETVKITKAFNHLITDGPINAVIEHPNTAGKKLYTIMHGNFILYPFFKFPYTVAKQAIKALYELPIDWNTITKESLKEMPSAERAKLINLVSDALDPFTKKGVKP